MAFSGPCHTYYAVAGAVMVWRSVEDAYTLRREHEPSIIRIDLKFGRLVWFTHLDNTTVERSSMKTLRYML